MTLDVGGTLIEPWPSVGHIYAQVAERFGVRADPERLDRQFAAAWQAKRSFDHSRAAWSDLVEHSFSDVADPLPEGCFTEIYERFAEPDAWRIFNDVLPALDSLALRGIRLAVISNWDERLDRLLDRLALRSRFELVTVSCDAGCTKPSPAIFQLTAMRLALAPEAIMHIGDSHTEDVVGARAAGLHARLVRRNAPPIAGEQISSLHELAEILN